MVAPTEAKTSDGPTNPTDALEKDAIELRLEKALFGDDAGFLDSLKRTQTGKDETGAVIRYGVSDNEDEEGAEDPDHLSDVADDDVGTQKTQCRHAVTDFQSSYFFLMPAPGSSLQRCRKTLKKPNHSISLREASPHGTIATTIESPFPLPPTLDCGNYETRKMTTWSVEENTSSDSVDSMNDYIRRQSG